MIPSPAERARTGVAETGAVAVRRLKSDTLTRS